MRHFRQCFWHLVQHVRLLKHHSTASSQGTALLGSWGVFCLLDNGSTCLGWNAANAVSSYKLEDWCQLHGKNEILLPNCRAATGYYICLESSSMFLLASACMTLCSCKIIKKKKSCGLCCDLSDYRFCCLTNNKEKKS